MVIHHGNIIFNAIRFVLHYRIHNHSVFITVADMEAVNYGHVVLWRRIGNWLRSRKRNFIFIE